MSQEKVDRYKEQKKNRKKIMKQEKCKRYLGYTATVVVIALIIGWAGFSIYKNHEANKPVSYTEVDLSALTDYYSNLQWTNLSGTNIIQLVSLVILILLSAFFSSAETALVTVNRIKMRTLADEGNVRAKRVLAITDHSSKMFKRYFNRK